VRVQAVLSAKRIEFNTHIKLNALCAESSCVDEVIEAADLLLAVYRPGSGVPANSESWQGKDVL
jgi:hypothetical protein